MSMNAPITNNLSAVLNSHEKLKQSFHGPSLESLRYHNSVSGENVSNNDFMLFEISVWLSQLVHFVKCGQTLLELNS